MDLIGTTLGQYIYVQDHSHLCSSSFSSISTVCSIFLAYVLLLISRSGSHHLIWYTYQIYIYIYICVYIHISWGSVSPNSSGPLSSIDDKSLEFRDNIATTQHNSWNKVGLSTPQKENEKVFLSASSFRCYIC